MVVRARAEITLTKLVDIEAVYRYYLLQRSEADPPTINENERPPKGWDDTEPRFNNSSTWSLYTVDLTLFSDGTWQYSKVSLSSSYEAAKEAYNKSEEARRRLQEWCSENDETKIEGSMIYTGSILADSIDGEVLKAGTIKAKHINIKDLFAQDIEATGTITGVTLNGARCNIEYGAIGGFTIGHDGIYHGKQGITSFIPSEAIGEGSILGLIGLCYYNAANKTLLDSEALTFEYYGGGSSLLRRTVLDSTGLMLPRLSFANATVRAHSDDLILNADTAHYICHTTGVFETESLLVNGNAQFNGTINSYKPPSQGAKDMFGRIPVVGTDGVMEVGKYIDFHSTDGANDYDLRLTANGSKLDINQIGRLYLDSTEYLYNIVDTGNNFFAPSTNGTVRLGGANHRWANFYSVAANFSGDVTINGILSVPNNRIRCQAIYDNTVTYATNTFIGSTEFFQEQQTRRVKKLSMTLKHFRIQILQQRDCMT